MNTIVNKVKHTSTHPYMSLSMKMIRDKRLSTIAKAILIEILSNDYKQWELNLNMLRKRMDIRRYAFDKGIDNLKENGYMIQKYIGNHKWSYIINEEGDMQVKEEELTVPLTMKEKCIQIREQRRQKSRPLNTDSLYIDDKRRQQE